MCGDPTADNLRMPVLHSPTLTASPEELRRVMKLQVPVIVKLAERRLPVAEVLRLGVGSIIEFAKRNEEPLQLMVNNRAIAVGEAVKVGENFGLRVQQVGDPRSIVAALGG
jgi:flagellar motor switch protein FliN/FliY